MRTPASIASVLVLMLGAASAMAQEGPTPTPAPAKTAPAAGAPAASTATAMNCGSGMKRHDHGAERGTPSAKAMPCAPATDAASGTKKKTRQKPIHDHTTFHKSQ